MQTSDISKIINVQNFEIVGRSLEIKGEEDSDKVIGRFLSFDENSKLYIGEDGDLEEIKDLKQINNINLVQEDIVTLLKFTKNNGIEPIFLEFSIYDQTDPSCEKFHTFIAGRSYLDLIKYKSRVQENITLFKEKENGRGLIVPCDNFYSHSYIYSSKYYNSNTVDLIEPIEINKMCLFVGSYNPPSIRHIDDSTVRTHASEFIISVMQEIKDIIKGSTTTKSNSKKKIIGITVPIIRPGGVTYVSNDGGKKEDRYKGGALFIFGKENNLNDNGNTTARKINLDKFILDLKIRHLDRAMMKSAISPYEHDVNSRSRAESTFSHEIKHVFGALQREWILEPEKLFWLSDSQISEHEKSKYLGKIEVWNKDLFKEIRIIPVEPFVKTMQELIFLWTGQYSVKSIPFNIEGLDIKTAIEECWNFSKNIMAMGVLFQSPLYSVEKINEVRDFYEKIMEFYGDIKIEDDKSGICESKLILNELESSTRNNAVLIRIFQAVTLNILKHFDLSKGCKIYLKKDGKKTVVSAMNNFCKDKYIDSEDSVIRIYEKTNKKYNQEEIRKVLRYIKSSKSNATKISASFHTEHVLNSLLNDLNGKVTSCNEQNEKSGENLLEFNFEI
jgi:hypothetical protein